MELSPELLNGLAGICALVTSLVYGALLWPTVRGLKRIAEAHDTRLDDHGERLSHLEGARPRRRTRGRR